MVMGFIDKANKVATMLYNVSRAKDKLGTLNKVSNIAQAGDAAGQIINAGQGVANWIGDIGKGYWENTADATSRAVYDQLTDVEAGKKGTGLTDLSGKFIHESGRQKENLRPADDVLNPRRRIGGYDFDTTVMPLDAPGAAKESYAARVSKGTSSPYGDNVGTDPVAPKDFKWAQSFYDNPEATAKAVGAAVGIGTPFAAGAFLHSFAQGGKPRSDYATTVTPSRGGYNSSVESAETSAFYKHQLEEQKYRHKMDLMNAREQSRIPGVQNTSVGRYGGGPLDTGSIVGMLQGGSSRKYF